jgi:hypothetical protein
MAGKVEAGHFYLVGGTKVTRVYKEVSESVYHSVSLWDRVTLAWMAICVIYVLWAMSRGKPMTLAEKYVNARDR